MKHLKKTAVLLALAASALFAAAPSARAYTVNLIYYTSRGLMDEHMAFLAQYDMVQLIYTGADGQIDPPNIYNGMPGGDDILWQSTDIGGAGPGQFLDLFQYSSNTSGTVYIRFFNAPVMGQVTYYGMSPLHTLSDLFGFDIWDITAGGLYLWTEYPFVVIPEPETWLTLLPALLLGMYMYRRSRKKVNRTAG
jgi:hypothetical protein